MKFSSLAPEIFMLTISGEDNDEKFIKMTHSFQWRRLCDGCWAEFILGNIKTFLSFLDSETTQKVDIPLSEFSSGTIKYGFYIHPRDRVPNEYPLTPLYEHVLYFDIV